MKYMKYVLIDIICHKDLIDWVSNWLTFLVINSIIETQMKNKSFETCQLVQYQMSMTFMFNCFYDTY